MGLMNRLGDLFKGEEEYEENEEYEEYEEEEAPAAADAADQTVRQRDLFR